MLHRNMRRRGLRPPAPILEETVVQISETAPRPNVALGMGAMSPLWPMFAVAATTGAAFWWMSRFTLGSFPTAAVNLEATLEQIPEEPVVEAAAAVVETVADAPVEIVEAVVEAAPALDGREMSWRTPMTAALITRTCQARSVNSRDSGEGPKAQREANQTRTPTPGVIVTEAKAQRSHGLANRRMAKASIVTPITPPPTITPGQ